MPYTNPQQYVVSVVDVALMNERGEILLIRRGKEPFKGHWALVGGKQEPGDFNIETTATREVKEEVGVDAELTHLLGVYSDPARDPRCATTSVAYVGKITSGEPALSAEAGEIRFFRLEEIPEQMAFDHKKILEDLKNKFNTLRPLKRRIYDEYKDKPIEYGSAFYKDKVRVAADALILNDKKQALLAQRCKPPFLGYWDIPGGHQLIGETLEQCLNREIKEELGVASEVGELFGVYSDRGRDTRCASLVAFYFVKIKSADFIKNEEVNNFRWFSLEHISREQIAYNNGIVLEDMRDYLAAKNNAGVV